MLNNPGMKAVALNTRQTRQPRARRQTTTLRSRGPLRVRWREACRAEPLETDESTMLQLVQEVQKRVRNDAEVVRIIRWLVNSGAVVLTGTFAGRHI